MPINTLAFAEKFSSELDKMVVQKAVTGFFADNVFRAKFVGARTVTIPDIDLVGLADYDRDDGYAKGKTTVTHTDYALTQDRGRQFQLDSQDIDETGIENLSGKVLGEFVRTKVAPEIDAYTLSKLAGIASTKNNTTTYNSAQVFEQLVDSINAVQAKAGYDSGEMVAFVDPTAFGALMHSAEFTRLVTVSDFKQGEINLKVKKVNDTVIIPVAADRMMTEYTFDSGATTTAGGFTPTATAGNLRMLILPKSVPSLVKKTEKMRIFTPDQNKDADAYLFNYRLYYDVFVKKSGLDFIHAVLTPHTAESNT